MSAWLTNEFVSGWHICIELDLLQTYLIPFHLISNSMVVQLYYSYCALFNQLFYNNQPNTQYISVSLYLN